MFCFTLSLGPRLVVLVVDRTDKVLHLFGSSIDDVSRFHLAPESFSFVLVSLGEYHDLWHIKGTELFTQLLFIQAVYCADLDHSVKFLSNFHVAVFKLFALLKLWVEEVHDPNLLSSVELEHRTQIQRDHICVLKKIWNFLLLLLLSASTTTLLEVEMEALTTTSSAATAKELSEEIVHVHASRASALALPLLIHPHSFMPLLVVNPSLVFVRKNLVCICNLLELCFGAIRVVQVFVWMILNGCLFECLLYLSVCGCLLDSQKFVVIFLFLLIGVLFCCLVVCPLLLLPLLLALIVEAPLLESLLEALSTDQAAGAWCSHIVKAEQHSGKQSYASCQIKH